MTDNSPREKPTQPAAVSGSKPVYVCMADVEPEEILWLWPNRIALGEITVVVGRAGIGKGFMAYDIAARVSTGSPFPDGGTSLQGSVILVTLEDHPSKIIQPRLTSQRADVSKIRLLKAVEVASPKGGVEERLFCLSNLDSLQEMLDDLRDCRLIVIDPLGDYLGADVDANRENQVRAILRPLGKLAADYGVAVVLISHYRKNTAHYADDMVLGSRAFTALARCVCHVTEDPTDTERRLFLPGKNNLAKKQDGLAFTIKDEPKGIGTLVWQKEPVPLTADEFLAQINEKPSHGPQRDKAAALLKDLLANGPMLAKEVKAAAKAEGIRPRTLDRAKDKLSVNAGPNIFGGPWFWSLPESDSVKTVAHSEDTGEHWDETGTLSESVSDETVAHSEDTGEVSEDTVDFYPGPEEEELPF